MSANSSQEGLVRWTPSIAASSMETDKDHPNIWSQMSYIPPKGPCNHKASIVSAACTCLRFMIHPIKAPTSFDCDGCGHHASFHAMQSKIDDCITSRWTREDGSFDREAYEADEEVQEVLAKRKRLGIERDMTSNGNLLMPDKARSTLVGQPGRKRIRTEKSG